MELEAAQLGRLIADERATASALAGRAELPAAAIEAVAGLRAHWRIDARWVEEQRMEMLELLDAERGLWLVVPQEPGARLEPTHSAEVWRHLTGLIPVSSRPSKKGNRSGGRRVGLKDSCGLQPILRAWSVMRSIWSSPAGARRSVR